MVMARFYTTSPILDNVWRLYQIVVICRKLNLWHQGNHNCIFQNLYSFFSISFIVLLLSLSPSLLTIQLSFFCHKYGWTFKWSHLITGKAPQSRMFTLACWLRLPLSMAHIPDEFSSVRFSSVQLKSPPII